MMDAKTPKLIVLGVCEVELKWGFSVESYLTVDLPSQFRVSSLQFSRCWEFFVHFTYHFLEAMRGDVLVGWGAIS